MWRTLPRLTTHRGLAGTLLAAFALCLAITQPALAAKKSSIRIAASKPKTATRGATVSVKVKVRNTSSKSAKSQVLSVRPAKGVRASIKGAKRGKLKLTLPPIKARKSRYYTVRLKGGDSAVPHPKSSISVSGHGATAKTSVSLTFANEQLAGRLFWTARPDGLGNLDIGAVYFVNGKWAYRGMPKGGLPTCTAQTAQGDGDGCVAYSYDSKTRAVSVAGQPGSFDGAHLVKVGSESFEELGLPSPGQRFDGGGSNYYSVGVCPFSCSVTFTQLKLVGNGTFARSGGISGSTPDSSFGALSPDKHGTYAVDAKGRIRLTFADGHAETHTIGFILDDAGNPSPLGKGVLLDDTGYVNTGD